MSEWKHRPAINFRPSADYREIVGGDGVCSPHNDGFTLFGVISERNANLIVAAPELLEVVLELKLIVEQWKDGTLRFNGPTYDRANEALIRSITATRKLIHVPEAPKVHRSEVLR